MNDDSTIAPVTGKPIPRVSIGMPVYNGEKFIRDALDSLLAQTFTDFELIISDNASTDGTEAICREYAEKDRRIRYMRQVENLGAIANFKFVLDEAVGEYFMWAAADDLWLPSFISSCVKLLDSESSAKFAITAYKSVSRFNPIFNRSFPNVLSCIQIDDQSARVLSYARQPFSSHKDNLVYALWRSDFIRGLISEMKLVLDGEFLIGTAMNEFALLKARGSYCEEVLFIKRYRYIPPGHLVDPLSRPFVYVWRLVNGRHHAPKPSGYSRDAFLADLQKLVEASGATTELIANIINANRSHLGAK